MDPSRVTVLVPTYNRAHWLGGAIESILAQTYADFHLVVSDNASTDATRETVARFEDPRVSYLPLEEHIGLNEHFNLCFDRTDTEYLFVLPDDDRMLPDLLERTVAVLDEKPRVGMVHGQANVVDSEERLIAGGHGMTGLEADTIERGAGFIRATMDMSYRVHASTALIRTAALSGVRLDERDYPVTDLALWMRMALRWDIAYLARPLASYRIHAGAYSAGAADVTEGGYSETADRVGKSLEAKLRFIEEHGDALEDRRDLARRARRRYRQELLAAAGRATVPERRLTSTARALSDCARRDARVAFQPAAWRLLAGSVLGRRGVSVVKRLLRRPEASLEVPT
jgi:glycosyltransferase involved in cell wall biosynthesis